MYKHKYSFWLYLFLGKDNTFHPYAVFGESWGSEPDPSNIGPDPKIWIVLIVMSNCRYAVLEFPTLCPEIDFKST